MKVKIEKVLQGVETSFSYMAPKKTNFHFSWHCHKEYELTIILEGTGQRFIGDSIDPFTDGDLVLIGPDLPHTWLSSDQDRSSSAIAIQFDREFLGGGLWRAPELNAVRRMLDRSARGLRFSRLVVEMVAPVLQAMGDSSPSQRVVNLLQALSICAEDGGEEVTGAYYAPAHLDSAVSARITEICEWIMEHFDQPIYQPALAERVGISSTALSRLFKKHTGRTFSAYVQELRIGKACELLAHTDRAITDICYEVGYNNLSNFNRQFLKNKNISPRSYRNEHRH